MSIYLINFCVVTLKILCAWELKMERKWINKLCFICIQIYVYTYIYTQLRIRKALVLPRTCCNNTITPWSLHKLTIFNKNIIQGPRPSDLKIYYKKKIKKKINKSKGFIFIKELNFSFQMSRYPSDCKVYVGDLGNSATKQELEDAFSHYGPLKNVWVARNPPGFAFVEFEDPRDAEDAVRALDGRTVCGRRARVEISNGKRSSRDRGPPRRGGSVRSYGEDKCYDCGERGHYARDCAKHSRTARRRRFVSFLRNLSTFFSLYFSLFHLSHFFSSFKNIFSNSVQLARWTTSVCWTKIFTMRCIVFCLYFSRMRVPGVWMYICQIFFF